MLLQILLPSPSRILLAVVVASVSAAVDIAVVVVAGRVGQLNWTGSIGWITGLGLGWVEIT